MSAQTNMPWAVYRCPRLGLGETPHDEEFISGHLSSIEAMQKADLLQRGDRAHSYLVGSGERDAP